MLWLLLTATVRPHAGVTLAVSDARVRRLQYARALVQWTQSPTATDAELVVVENSGEDLERLVRDALPISSARSPRRISAPPPEALVVRGKGAAEAAMIDYAVSRLDDLADDDILFKITGRLFIRNAQRVIPLQQGSRQIVMRASLDWTYADTRFLGASGDIWRECFDAMDAEVDESRGIFLEHVVARRSYVAASSGAATVRRFAGRPHFVGLGGTGGHNYGGPRAFWQRLTRAPLEAFLRHLPPDKQY